MLVKFVLSSIARSFWLGCKMSVSFPGTLFVSFFGTLPIHLQHNYFTQTHLNYATLFQLKKI